MIDKLPTLPLDDPPAIGRSGDLCLPPIHPAFVVDAEIDELTVRLLFLLRTHPGLVAFRADDLTSLDVRTKTLLLSQIDKALGLNKTAPKIL